MEGTTENWDPHSLSAKSNSADTPAMRSEELTTGRWCPFQGRFSEHASCFTVSLQISFAGRVSLDAVESVPSDSIEMLSSSSSSSSSFTTVLTLTLPFPEGFLSSLPFPPEDFLSSFLASSGVCQLGRLLLGVPPFLIALR